MSVLTCAASDVDSERMATRQIETRMAGTSQRLATTCLITLVLLCAALSSGFAAGTHELLFREGTLDTISGKATLEYRRDVSAPGSRPLQHKNTGLISLILTSDDMAELHFGAQGDRRRVGAFPASVGNPLIMYFLETVVRDLSGLAGGSPYYMRNRIKAELLKEHPVQQVAVQLGDRQVEAQSVVLYPFRDDPASDRMRGIETLALSVTVSGEVPGWYYALKAETTEERGTRSALPDTLPAYSSTILFQGLEGQE